MYGRRTFLEPVFSALLLPKHLVNDPLASADNGYLRILNWRDVGTIYKTHCYGHLWLISYKWWFLWDSTLYKWKFNIIIIVLITGMTPARTEEIHEWFQWIQSSTATAMVTTLQKPALHFNFVHWCFRSKSFQLQFLCICSKTLSSI